MQCLSANSSDVIASFEKAPNRRLKLHDNSCQKVIGYKTNSPEKASRPFVGNDDYGHWKA
jgi:hypothetical protein